MVQQVGPSHTYPPEFREVVTSTSKGVREVGEVAIGEYDESSGARRARITDAGAISEYSDKIVGDSKEQALNILVSDELLAGSAVRCVDVL